MLRNIGPVELLILLVIVVLVFGAGRLADVGGALGKSIREFRREVGPADKETEEEKKDKESESADSGDHAA